MQVFILLQLTTAFLLHSMKANLKVVEDGTFS